MFQEGILNLPYITLTLCRLGNFSTFCCRLLTFFRINLLKKFFQDDYQSVKWFDKADILFGLFWVQTVYKGFQQISKVATSKERGDYEYAVHTLKQALS